MTQQQKKNKPHAKTPSKPNNTKGGFPVLVQLASGEKKVLKNAASMQQLNGVKFTVLESNYNPKPQPPVSVPKFVQMNDWEKRVGALKIVARAPSTTLPETCQMLTLEGFEQYPVTVTNEWWDKYKPKNENETSYLVDHGNNFFTVSPVKLHERSFDLIHDYSLDRMTAAFNAEDAAQAEARKFVAVDVGDAPTEKAAEVLQAIVPAMQEAHAIADEVVGEEKAESKEVEAIAVDAPLPTFKEILTTYEGVPQVIAMPSDLPAQLVDGDLQTHEIAEITRSTFIVSGLDPAAWNALSVDDIRERILDLAAGLGINVKHRAQEEVESSVEVIGDDEPLGCEVTA